MPIQTAIVRGIGSVVLSATSDRVAVSGTFIVVIPFYPSQASDASSPLAICFFKRRNSASGRTRPIT